MIINQKHLLELAPILNMEPTKKIAHRMTYGLGEAGYDIRVKQEVKFEQDSDKNWQVVTKDGDYFKITKNSKFTIASAIEEFSMPPNLVGRVCDKSSWARKGLSVFNTVVEPGWKGFLTLELVYHGNTELIIPAGAPIAQILFEEVHTPISYTGRYQNQANEPTPTKEAV